jgi:RNA polymerase-binding transcription factor DksA
MAPTNDKTDARLAAIASKGWEVAERLATLKANKDFELSDITGPNLDLSATKEERLRAYLDMIERARARLLASDGSYGRCQTCSYAFTEGELDETPWIEICAQCQS